MASPIQFPFLNSGHTTKPKFLRTSHSVTFPYFSNNSRRSSERQLLPRLPINIFVGMVTVGLLIYLKNKAHVSYEKSTATDFLTNENANQSFLELSSNDSHWSVNSMCTSQLCRIKRTKPDLYICTTKLSCVDNQKIIVCIRKRKFISLISKSECKQTLFYDCHALSSFHKQKARISSGLTFAIHCISTRLY